MKLYLTNVSPNLPPWATITSITPDLVELEINDNHPDFQSLINGLASEIQRGVVGVKATDLCEALVKSLLYETLRERSNSKFKIQNSKQLASD